MWELWPSKHGAVGDPGEEAWRTRTYQTVNEKSQLETVAVSELLDTSKPGYVFGDFLKGRHNDDYPST